MFVFGVEKNDEFFLLEFSTSLYLSPKIHCSVAFGLIQFASTRFWPILEQIIDGITNQIDAGNKMKSTDINKFCRQS